LIKYKQPFVTDLWQKSYHIVWKMEYYM